MEYIIVKTAEHGEGSYKVLLNGVENGTTGNTLVLGGRGYVRISAVKTGCQERLVFVENTTITHPMIIELD